MKTLLLLTSTLFLLIASGCLTTPEPNRPVRVELVYQVDELGQTFERGEDSINITEFKFSIDRFNLIAEDSLVLQSGNRVDAMIFSFNESFTNENLILGVELGFEDVTQFEGYEMFVRPISSTDNIFDQDFFGDDENFSVVAIGTYNGKSFTYNSSFSADRFQDLGSVRVGEDLETLSIKKTLNISDVFIDLSDNSVIDPTDDVNESRINNLFIENLIINASAVTRFSE